MSNLQSLSAAVLSSVSKNRWPKMINEYRMTGSMAKAQEEKPKTFTEVLSIIEQFRGSGDEPLWYRGCGRSDHKLQPSLYRHRSVKKTSALANLERRLLTRF